MDEKIKESIGADRVPPPLRKILDLDVKATKNFVVTVEKMFPAIRSANSRLYMKALEISCHGVPWFALVLISIYLLTSQSAREVEINLFFGLILDVMIVAFIKACTRRRRPAGNNSKDMFMATGVDKFSFPSGHASRAAWLALFFTQWATPDMWIVFKIILTIWAISVAISRVLLRRHHLLDVTAGIALGFVEFLLSGILWIGPVACQWLGDWIATTDDEYNG